MARVVAHIAEGLLWYATDMAVGPRELSTILVHTADAAGGLGLTFTPSTELAAGVLHRMFPWAPTDIDPWQALLWANGRLDLPGRERQSDWRWHCAPLSEWRGDSH